MRGTRVHLTAGVLALTACGRHGFESAAAVDAPPSDATPGPDATHADAPPTPVCDRFPSAAYCTDFEGGALGTALDLGGSPVPSGGVAGSDGWQFVVAPGQGARLRVSAPASESLFVRGQFRMDAPSPVASYVVLAQLLTAAFSEKLSFDVAPQDRAQVVSTVEGGVAGRQGAPETLPRGPWFCWELQIDSAELGGRAEARVAGVSVAEIEAVDTQPATGWRWIEVGALASPQNTEAFTVTLDELVVSTSPIGCP